MSTPLDEAERALCAATAAALRAQRTLAAWSLGADVLAAAWLLAGAAPGVAAALAGVLVLALGERVHAWRLRFDEALFSALAGGRIATWAALDDSLHALGLRRAAAGPPRPLAERVQGTRRLLLRHGAAVLLQTAALAGAALAHAHALHS